MGRGMLLHCYELLRMRNGRNAPVGNLITLYKLQNARQVLRAEGRFALFRISNRSSRFFPCTKSPTVLELSEPRP